MNYFEHNRCHSGLINVLVLHSLTTDHKKQNLLLIRTGLTLTVHSALCEKHSGIVCRLVWILRWSVHGFLTLLIQHFLETSSLSWHELADLWTCAHLNLGLQSALTCPALSGLCLRFVVDETWYLVKLVKENITKIITWSLFSLLWDKLCLLALTNSHILKNQERHPFDILHKTPTYNEKYYLQWEIKSRKVPGTKNNLSRASFGCNAAAGADRVQSRKCVWFQQKQKC